MRMTYIDDERDLHKFVEEAAEFFSKDPKHRTYSNPGEPRVGNLFAVRWGMGDDCILVFRISEDLEPTLYQNIILSKE